jgi:hypothetical protein
MILLPGFFGNVRSITVGVLLVIGFFAQTARGDFIGPYFLPNPGLFFVRNHPSPFSVGAWTATHQSTPAFPNPYINTSSSSFVMFTDYASADGFSYSEEIELTISIAASGFLSFDYAIDRQPGPAINPDNDRAGYLLNGTFVALGVASGSVQNLPVEAGDSFGFFVYAGPRCITCNPSWGSGTEITVTNFNAPVPEPSSNQLLLFCLTGLALVKRMRVGLTNNPAERQARTKRF